MNKKLIVLFILITMFSIVILHAQIEFIEKLRGGVPEPVTNISYHFNLTRSHVIEVPVKINNAEDEMKFVFDTAGNTMIGWNIADKLDLVIDSMVTPMQTMYMAKTDSIITCGLTVKDFTVTVMDFKNTFDIGNDELQGMIGPDFIRFFRTTINYNTNELIFGTNDIPLCATNEHEHLLDMEILMPYHPSVQMHIGNDIQIMGRIDTGLHYAIVLPIPFIEQLPESEKEKLIPCFGYFARWPLVDSYENFLYKSPEIAIGDMTFKDVGVIFANYPFNTTALLGKDFLEQFVTTLDFPNRKVLMKETEGPSKDMLFSTGINVRKLDDGSFEIVGIWQGSPADNAGIELDDEIIEVNGVSASEIETGDFYLMRFDTQVKELNLEIQKPGGEEAKEIILKKEYLVE